MPVSPRLLVLLSVTGGGVALVALVLGYLLAPVGRDSALPLELNALLLTLVVGAATMLRSPLQGAIDRHDEAKAAEKSTVRLSMAASESGELPAAESNEALK
jgi:hypothetical protein